MLHNKELAVQAMQSALEWENEYLNIDKALARAQKIYNFLISGEIMTTENESEVKLTAEQEVQRVEMIAKLEEILANPLVSGEDIDASFIKAGWTANSSPRIVEEGKEGTREFICERDEE